MSNPRTMSAAELFELIADSRGEWEQMEFKKTTGELQGGMESLCGFLNGLGGKVLFGVTNAGRVQGQDVTDATLQEVANAIRRLEPPAGIEQIRVPIAGTKEVLILETTTISDGPYTFDGRAYVRIGNTTSRMPQPEYERRLLARSRNQRRWEEETAEGYSLDSLDTREIRKTLRAAVEAGRLESTVTTSVEALDRFHLRVDGKLLRAAVVLFGRQLLPRFPQCSLRLARFKGTNKTEFLDQRQLDGHAFLLLEEADLFLRRHLPVAGRIESGMLERKDQPLYPPLALRSAGQCSVPSRLLDPRRGGQRGDVRRPARDRQLGPPAAGDHGRRPEARPRLASTEPFDCGSLLPARSDRALGPGHATDRGTLSDSGPTRARLRGAGGQRRRAIPRQPVHPTPTRGP